MPYKDSPYFKTPCRTETLWRYMHIDKFLAMLSGESLYFPNIYLFDDRFEGTLSNKSLDEIRKISLLDEKNTLIYDDEAFYRKRKSLRELDPEQEKMESGRIFEQLLRDFLSHLIYCNSWFQRGKESHSMWAEYGDKSPTSIAIQTTVGDLIEGLESDEYNIHIGTVEYKDYLTGDIEGYEDFPSIDLNDPGNVLKHCVFISYRIIGGLLRSALVGLTSLSSCN